MLPPTDDYLRSGSCRFVPGWEDALVRLDLIVKGGSDRYYYRASAHGGTGPESAIIMVYTDKRADNPAFFSATEVLRHCGARIMEIYHHDETRRIAWMEDLGRELHLHARALAIPHPAGGTLEVAAAIAPHMEVTFRYFGFANPKPAKSRWLRG